MLYQVHHQFKDRTEMCSQAPIETMEALEKLVADTKAHFPLPPGAQYLVCNEQSEFFVWTHAENVLNAQESK